MRAGVQPAAPAWRPTRADYQFIDLTSLDSLLVNPVVDEQRADRSADKFGAAAEGRAGRLIAARSLLVGGVVASLLVAAALGGVVAIAAEIVRAFNAA